MSSIPSDLSEKTSRFSMGPKVFSKFYYSFVLVLLVVIQIVPAIARRFDDEQSTVLEDVVGTYELESLKNLISDSSKVIAANLSQVSQKLSNSEEGKKDLEELKKKHLALQDTVESLEKSVQSSRGYVEEVYSGLKENLQSLKNQFIQSLSNLKLYVEHTNQQLQSVLRRTGLAAEVSLASDCFDLYNLRYNASGAYWLSKLGLRVLCDMETEGGGWLVIQRRAKVTNQVNFQQDWFTYKEGFGSLDTEFWIGNDVLHILTNQKPYELRIEMEDYENGTFYATYSYFRVGTEESNYLLDIGNYSGNATDAFTYHHGRQFSTLDRDNDKYDEGSCANYFSGGWWYDRCYDTHLNGIYPDPPDRKNASFITWWARNEGKEKVPLVLTRVQIKMRPMVR